MDECVDIAAALPKGPFLVASDCREPWQCESEDKLRSGLDARQQWSEPFTVFAWIEGRFVQCNVDE